MEHELRNGFGGANDTTETILQFVNSYLSQTKGGVFIGIGLVMMLWTVINLVNNIEITFNGIWNVKKARNMYRKTTDYFSMFLLMPILIVLSAGLSFFMSTMLKGMEDFVLLAPILKVLVRLIPFVLTWFMFTGLYIFMPNTKVTFKYALLSGVLAGTVYQAFQFLYIGSQLWVSHYNAIYGSFAALPMFLLWLQISWTICLFGAELAYASQNIKHFSFDKDTQNISRRYRDFISILIMSLIAKRFEQNLAPYTAVDISKENQIPIRLTNQVLDQLLDIEIIHEVVTDQKSEDITYQPSVDINQLHVALLLDKLDTYGSEDFKVDKEEEFSEQWKVLAESRENYYKSASKVLLKDL
jgi:membrane protein